MASNRTIRVFVLLIALFAIAARAQIPTNPQAWPGPPGSYRGTINFLVFTVMGNYQHSTASCFLDGAFVALNGVVPAFGQQPYGEMAVLRSHPNYKEMIATLITAKAAGQSVDIQLIRNPALPSTNQYPPLYAPTTGSCDQIPIVGAVGVI